MCYRVKLLAGSNESVADGDTEEQAIKRALLDSISVRSTAEGNPFEVALVMFNVYGASQYVAYATTLGKYRIDTN